jgi:hypothetical protein
MPPKSQSIAFRLSDDKLRSLAGLAAGVGQSAGEYARELVLDKLDGEETTSRELESLRAEVRNLAKELVAFRAEFALAVEVLLISGSSGKPVSHEHAKRWVDERIRDRKPYTEAD